MSDNYPVDGELRRQAERIEALEQAHAELAAKVAKLETRVDVHKAGIEWCHEHVKGSELSEDAPNVVEQAYYAHRVFPTGLLAREFARVTRIGPDDVDYVPALESPVPAPDPLCPNPECDPKTCNRAYCFVTNSIGAGLVPAPDPVCQCGHPKRDHSGDRADDFDCLIEWCTSCRGWDPRPVPTAEPEPAPLDPGFRIAIREAVVRMAALNVTVQEVDDITDAVIHTIRTYGRDGAR